MMFGSDGVLAVEDALDAFLLGCFFFGLVFTALSLVLGVAHVGADHGHEFGHHHGGNGHDNDAVTPISVGTILAFLTWFGGVAYLARNGFGIWAAVSVAIGLAGGFIGGWLIFRLLKLVRRSETVWRASDERFAGALARVTSSIREGGTGEIVYELHGVRQVSAARSANGRAIARGTEVLVLKRAGGFALVETWADAMPDEFATPPPVVELGEPHRSPVDPVVGTR